MKANRVIGVVLISCGFLIVLIVPSGKEVGRVFMGIGPIVAFSDFIVEFLKALGPLYEVYGWVIGMIMILAGLAIFFHGVFTGNNLVETSGLGIGLFLAAFIPINLGKKLSNWLE